MLSNPIIFTISAFYMSTIKQAKDANLVFGSVNKAYVLGFLARCSAVECSPDPILKTIDSNPLTTLFFVVWKKIEKHGRMLTNCPSNATL